MRLCYTLVSCPDPPEKRKEGLVFSTTFLVTWGGVEWHKECIFSHALHAACKIEARMIPSCAVCMIALPVSKQRHSLDPASASNKTVVEYLATISPELELANGSVCKACFTKLKKAATYLATLLQWSKELAEVFSVGHVHTTSTTNFKLRYLQMKSRKYVYAGNSTVKAWERGYAEIACASLVPSRNAVICGLGTRLSVCMRI